MAEPSGRVTASLIFTEIEPVSQPRTFFPAVGQRRDTNLSLPFFLGLDIRGKGVQQNVSRWWGLNMILFVRAAPELGPELRKLTYKPD